MSSINYTNQIIDAIQAVVDNAVANAGYDRTLKAIISKCVDSATGKYVVKYQDSSFYAYSTSADVTYNSGASVYVLVPANDMSQNKTIIGTVDKLGSDYVSALETEDGYEVIGTNIANSSDKFELCSYSGGEVITLYDKENNINLINLDTFSASTYLQDADYIMCGANFKTALTSEQKMQGDYGIVFEVKFKDNAIGELVTKNYVVNVNNMNGNPYNYTKGSKQLGVFEIDGTNFAEISKVYIYDRNFPKTDITKAADIFVSAVEIDAATALTLEEVQNLGLSIITPQGIYFDDNDSDTTSLQMHAQIRVKGQAIDSDSNLAEYYWFRENNSIDRTSLKYNRYGGAGWECLNNYNLVDTEDLSTPTVQWLSATYLYNTKKSDNVAKETKYKCVAVYNNATVEKTVIIYNYSSEYDITIKSDLGTQFYYDLGRPTLTCYVNGEEKPNNYVYSWSSVDNANNYTVLEETTTYNEEYNNAVAAYNALIAKITEEKVLKASVQEELNEEEEIIESYKNVNRVEKNKIIYLETNNISQFTTYKCSVSTTSGTVIGTSSIVIFNSLSNTNEYSLVLNEGNQVFKYDTNGLAPTSGTLEDPQTIYPLSFILYDNEGREVDQNAISAYSVEWTIPTTKTRLSAAEEQGEPISTDDESATYSGSKTFNFNIQSNYNEKNINNEIQLVVYYKDKVVSASTNFTFVKEGENGTNGTDFVCKIVPNIADGTILDYYPTIIHDESSADENNYTLNFTPLQTGKWFRAELWHDGVRIFNSVGSGTTDEDKDATVTWSILKNHYGKDGLTSIDDESLITYDAINQIFAADFENLTDKKYMANLIKCEIEYEGVIYYNVTPMITAFVSNSDYEIELTKGTGFRSVLYTTDGQEPSYNNANPFTIEIYQKINGFKEDISLLQTSEYAVTYDWDISSKEYRSEWKYPENLIYNKSASLKLDKNKIYYRPIDTYDGLCVNNALICYIMRDDDTLATLHMPIHFYLNRYGNSALNSWDGNSISIDDSNGVILAPQVGAGKKEEDNGFTGVFMGQIQEAGKSEAEYGLYGYNNGERTIALSSVDGSARFGKTGSGQIVIDPSSNEAILTSGDYDETAGTGMQINLSEPSIKWANGNFEVDKDGNVTAQQYALKEDLAEGTVEVSPKSISGLETTMSDVTDLNKTVTKFQANVLKSTIIYPCSSDNKISANIVTTAQATLTYKGEIITSDFNVDSNLTVTPDNDELSSAIKVTRSFENGIITLTFTTKTLTDALENLTHSYHLKFYYPTSQETVEKDLVVEFIPSGASGTGIEIDHTDLAYAESTSGQVIPGESEWKDTPPSERTDGTYLWTKTTIYYKTTEGASAGSSTSYSVAGSGTTGRGVKYIKPIYYLKYITSDVPTPTHEIIVNTDVVDKWTYQIPTYVDEAVYYTSNETYYTTNDYAYTDVVIDNAFNKAIMTAEDAYASAADALTEAKKAKSLIISLSNDTHIIPADKDGNVTSYDGAETTILVYYGTVDVTSSATITPTLNNVEGEWANPIYKVTKLNADNGYVDFNISYTDSEIEATFNQTTRFSLSKSKAGQDGDPGDNAELINITATDQVFKRENSKSDYVPTSIILTPTFTNCTFGKWEYYNGSSWIEISGATQNLSVASGYTYTSNDTITFKCTSSDAKTSDIITLSRLSNGDDGTSAISPFIAYLTNEAQTYAYGTAKDISTQLIAYQGTTSKTVTIKTVNGVTASTSATATGKTGMNFYVSSTSAATDPTIHFVSTTALGQTQSEQIPIVYRIADDTTDKTIYFSYSSTTQGSAARIYEIDTTSKSVVKKVDDTFSPETITFSSYYRSGTSATKTSYSGRWLIQTSIDGSTWTTVYASSVNEASYNYTVSGISNKLIRAYLGPSGTTPTISNALDIQTIPILNDAVDVEIGARNLLIQTDESQTLTGTGTTNETKTLYSYSSYYKNNYYPKTVTTDDSLQVTTSFNWTAGKDVTSGNFYIQLNGWPYTGLSGNIIVSNTNQSGHVEFTATIKKDANNDTSYTGVMIGEDNLTGDITISDMKLEIGNVSTDWSPAPEDFDSDINDTNIIAQRADTNTDKINKALYGEDGETGLAKDISDVDAKAGTAQTAADEAKYSSIESVTSLYYKQSCDYILVEAGTLYDVNTVYYDENHNKTRPDFIENSETDYKSLSSAKYLTKDMYVRVTPTSPDSTDYANWNRTKLAWEDGYIIWTILETKFKGYSINPDKYATTYTGLSTVDGDIISADDKRYLDSSAVLNGMRGSNNIYYNKTGFYVYDSSDASSSHNCIYMNNKGISFASKDSSGNWQTNSVWDIDGTFDAKNIKVINLNADSITNGVLTLGKTSETQSESVDGKMIIKDDEGFENIVLDTRRAVYKLSNGGYVIIAKDIGFQVCDSKGSIEYGSSLTWTTVSSGTYENNKNYYSSHNILNLLIPGTDYTEGATISNTVYTASSGNIFETSKQRINTEVNYFDSIRMIHISSTSNGGAGIAFVKVY